MTLIYFILILGLTVFVHEFGHFIMAKRSGVYCYEFSLGMGPKIYSFKRKNDETTYSIRLLPIGGYVQMAGEEIEEDKKIPKAKRMQSKTILQRLSIVLAGVFNNFILGLLLLFLMSIIYGSPNNTPIIKNSYLNASKLGIKSGDVVKKINNKKVHSKDDVNLEIMMLKEGTDLSLELVDKSGNTKNVKLIPTKTDEGYKYGLEFDNTEYRGFFHSIKYSFTKFTSLFRNMIKIFKYLFTGKLGLNSLSGPVGIYNVIGEQSKLGFENVIYLAAYISINVGFVNLIPFPAFDGGRALFLIIEKIRKKPIDQKIENIIHTVGFVILMILIVVITIKDIIKLF